jgi:hypothetical protein
LSPAGNEAENIGLMASGLAVPNRLIATTTESFVDNDSIDEFRVC